MFWPAFFGDRDAGAGLYSFSMFYGGRVYIARIRKAFQRRFGPKLSRFWSHDRYQKYDDVPGRHAAKNGFLPDLVNLLTGRIFNCLYQRRVGLVNGIYDEFFLD